MKKLFNYIDVEDYHLLSDKIYQYIVNHTAILQDKRHWNTLVKDHVLECVPELHNLYKVIPADPTLIGIFYTPPGFSGGVHVDWGPFNYRFLMPVYNCEGSYTKFFDLNGNEVIEKYSGENNTDPYYEVQSKFPLVEVASAETIKPLILNVKAPHGIFTNPSLTGPRLTCTIGFENYPLEHFLE
jgi:hypothetical protein